MHERSLAELAIVLTLMTSPTTALAELPASSVRVDCPALANETRAAVEARAEAELSSLRVPDGEVGVVCSADSAVVSWTPADGLTAGALLSASYMLPLAWCDISAGPRLEALARPIAVDVAGEEVFRVPSFVAALAVDVATPRHQLRPVSVPSDGVR